VDSVSTLLCFDFGLSNIGVAVGNTLTEEARPLTILSANNGKPNWDAVVALVEEWQPNALVVGNPIDDSGQATELSEKTSRFARQLNGRLQLEVMLHDERFSSKEAKSRAREMGHKGDYATNPIDDLAASIILESWLRGNS
jgi:putative Holliday junction resolvase